MARDDAVITVFTPTAKEVGELVTRFRKPDQQSQHEARYANSDYLRTAMADNNRSMDTWTESALRLAKNYSEIITNTKDFPDADIATIGFFARKPRCQHAQTQRFSDNRS